MQAEVTLLVDGCSRTLAVGTRMTLLDMLRERLGVTSPKKGCDHGQCGACTVLLDDRRVTTCLALAVAHDGAEIVTADGLGDADALHPLAQAFLEHDGFQCGYCTPGQICSAVGMLAEARAGWPSHVSDDLSARRRGDRLRRPGAQAVASDRGRAGAAASHARRVDVAGRSPRSSSHRHGRCRAMRSIDSRFGHVVNHDFAEYHIPTHADVPEIEAHWLDGHDPHTNPIGSKGIGEIGIVGAAAAITNAAHHATGIRVRDLPITADKLLR